MVPFKTRMPILCFLSCLIQLFRNVIAPVTFIPVEKTSGRNKTAKDKVPELGEATICHLSLCLTLLSMNRQNPKVDPLVNGK